jgi:hypothetical protein
MSALGLIISAVGSGQIVVRTGRYKILALGAAIPLGVGLFLVSNLRADMPLPLLFVWTFITGLGVMRAVRGLDQIGMRPGWSVCPTLTRRAWSLSTG